MQLLLMEGSRQMAEAVSANEFAEIYNDFGYDEALSRDPASLSYTYDLGPDMRLFNAGQLSVQSYE